VSGVTVPACVNGHLSQHASDHYGPCLNHDINLINNNVIDRRHFKRANVIFAGGHGEWLLNLSATNIVP
jgi:hypothetical protein